ncbi:A disintegrin and metalloproteinase with thrombospondin motifs 7-like isoform X2 [Anthonomus grandis grandis]|nr:A disintegrin and metalloproteinase with thrombospondin motifs 7-like isoform X2 [Anthonomus grandis grandis]
MRRRIREELLDGNDVFKTKRDTTNMDKFIEVAVVCDKHFLKFHQGRDVELYVMTIMNMVADFYHDASLGHQIDVVVVRIIYLEKEEEEIDLEISQDAAKTLRSFCDWAIKLNTPLDSPNHFDMALLLTRYDLCANAAEDCGLTGLAYVGGACSKDEQCGINEDNGLGLSVIVAHEMGHLMGAEHDEEDSPCASQDQDGSNFVMSPYVNAYTIRWSTCSRSMVTALVESNLAECLYDQPDTTLYPYSDNLPGVVYDANEQCKFEIPAAVGVCNGLKEKICENLICKLNKIECVGKDQVPADGTKCAENKWCFKKKCIEMGARPEAIHGGWGDYGPWSACTRTCGGGISFAERECNNPSPANRGRYCSGERKKLKICNLQPCPENDATFRQQQCTEQNTKPWNGQYHKWKASLKETEPCALYCLNEEMALSKLENVVKDGTPCKHGTRNMCISGACKAVGCDDKLDSEAVEDRCGVCNGDGTQCKIVEETYKEIGQGYTKVVVIPSGARKVVIEELKPSGNIIAISDSSESKFYLNGDNTEQLDNEYKIGKQIGIYTHIEPKKEKLIINGPLKEDLVFFVDFFEEVNPGYLYHWAEPAIDSNYEPHYHWEAGEFEECSDACDGGTQKAVLSCMEDTAGKVSANFCAGIDKPKDIIKNCNEEPCKISWKIGSWGKCRACKGKGGVRVRVVECIKQNRKPGSDGILVEDCNCHDTRPGAVELCEATDKCGKKRMASYIPGQFQESIYQQMFPQKLDRVVRKDSDDEEEPQANKDKEVLAEVDKNATNSSLKERVGHLVHDFKPIEDQILVKYTLRPNPLQYNLSDKAYAQMGDVIGDIIDTENKIVFTGKAAALLEHGLEHVSNTTVKVKCEEVETLNKNETENDLEDNTVEEETKEFENTEESEAASLEPEAEVTTGEISEKPVNESEVEVGEKKQVEQESKEFENTEEDEVTSLEPEAEESTEKNVNEEVSEKLVNESKVEVGETEQVEQESKEFESTEEGEAASPEPEAEVTTKDNIKGEISGEPINESEVEVGEETTNNIQDTLESLEPPEITSETESENYISNTAEPQEVTNFSESLEARETSLGSEHESSEDNEASEVNKSASELLEESGESLKSVEETSQFAVEETGEETSSTIEDNSSENISEEPTDSVAQESILDNNEETSTSVANLPEIVENGETSEEPQEDTSLTSSESVDNEPAAGIASSEDAKETVEPSEGDEASKIEGEAAESSEAAESKSREANEVEGSEESIAASEGTEEISRAVDKSDDSKDKEESESKGAEENAASEESAAGEEVMTTNVQEGESRETATELAETPAPESR